MNILIFNQPFHPDVVATAQIAKDLASALIAQGHQVTAVASRSVYGQTGAALPKRETVDGINIIRVGAARFGKTTTIGRLLDFMGYYLRAAWVGLRREKADAAICLTTPPFIVLVGLLLKTLRGSRVVYWLMDVYPDVMIAHGMIGHNGAIHRLLRALHRFALKRADVVVALGECMKKRLVEQGASEHNIVVIPVWSVAGEGADHQAEAAAFTPANDNYYRQLWNVGKAQLLVMYSGNFGLAHDVQTFLAAAKMLKNDARVRFAFVGGGKRKTEVERFVREYALGNCILAEYQPREKLAELLAAADLHLITMAPGWEGLVAPSKFYGAAAAGRPCVFVGPRGSDVARLIEAWGAGAVIEPGDAAGLAGAIDTWAMDKGRGGESLRRLGRSARQGAAQWADRLRCLDKLCALVEGKDVATENNAGAEAGDGATAAPRQACA